MLQQLHRVIQAGPLHDKSLGLNLCFRPGGAEQNSSRKASYAHTPNKEKTQSFNVSLHTASQTPTAVENGKRLYLR